MSVEYYDSLVKLMKRLTKLENYQEYMTIKKGIPNYSTGYSESFKNPPKFLKIKTLGLYYSAAREWSGMGENGDEGMESFARYISRHVALETFKGKLIKSYIPYQDILLLMKNFKLMLSLKHIDFEFLK